MRTTQQMSITLPNEMAEFVREKVARGDYASDSEVLRDALRVLRERDRAVEAWLREQVVPAAKALRENPERALSADEVRAELKKSRTGRG
jgi:putative addiction module CopG family antidote